MKKTITLILLFAAVCSAPTSAGSADQKPSPLPQPEAATLMVDSDKDGIPEHLDRCPGSPDNSKVDKRGCVVSITLKVDFAPGKAVVREQYLPEIERLAEYLKQYPNQNAEIQGHTDNSGSPSKNHNLSQARAKAVRKVLVAKYGIAAGRLTAKGYGQNRPVTGNDTLAGREKNRRVEAVIRK